MVPTEEDKAKELAELQADLRAQAEKMVDMELIVWNNEVVAPTTALERPVLEAAAYQVGSAVRRSWRAGWAYGVDGAWKDGHQTAVEEMATVRLTTAVVSVLLTIVVMTVIGWSSGLLGG
jgi:mannose/fructose/N-acetylgalactosamine-specific phosphotransferase system component IIC